jgi:hypothetical protein
MIIPPPHLIGTRVSTGEQKTGFQEICIGDGGRRFFDDLRIHSQMLATSNRGLYDGDNQDAGGMENPLRRRPA